MIKGLSVLHDHEPFLNQYNVRLSPYQFNLLGRYLEELLQWNKAFNLTGLHDIDSIVRHLLLDSLICAAQLRTRGPVLDIGSGAGFPAVPIKIYNPSVDIHLLEPTRKRANFLRHVRRVLCLSGFDIFHATLEQHKQNYSLLYGAVTARAVMSPLDLVQLCSDLLDNQGELVLFLGEKGKNITNQILKEKKATGLALNSLIEYNLPGLRSTRHLVFLKKV